MKSLRIISVLLCIIFLVGCVPFPVPPSGSGAASDGAENTGREGTVGEEGTAKSVEKTTARGNESSSGRESETVPSRPPESTAAETSVRPYPGTHTRESLRVSAREALSGMTLREKVGQLFIVTPEALDGNAVTELTDGAKTALRSYPCGGIIMFGANIVSPQQIKDFNDELQKASALPLFIAVDEEGGQVARLAKNPAFGLPKYKSAAAVGALGKTEAEKMGTVIGGYLTKYGFNVDFAPVADVFTNPDNTVIGSRAFSSDPAAAADCAQGFAAGLRQSGVIAAFKHFPGHGDTTEDSHAETAVSHKTRRLLSECELIPFMRARDDDLIMVGHIAVPEVTGDKTPATLSKKIISSLLRGDAGFGGLVVTDSLSMGAVTDSYTAGEAAVKALSAGCDILLMPENYRAAFDAVVNAVENGTLSADRINDSVLRILELKKKRANSN